MFENGSQFLRADFHLHTRADKEFEYSGEDDRYITDYCDQLEAEKIHIGVITNHNKFQYDEYKNLKKKAARKDILLLPGFELAVKEGAASIHVLFVFDPDQWFENGTDYVSQVLTALSAGIANFTSENAHCGQDFQSCLKKISEMNRDFFVIFAHVEQAKGLWKECTGPIISPMSRDPLFKKYVLGFQKVRTRTLAEKVHQWMEYDVASVEGSDPKQISEIGKGEQKCYLKLGSLTYSAVKFALRDYSNRVFANIPEINHGYIRSVQCIGGRLDSQVFSPSAELNTLIGIRGSGKSSIIEIIRYALGIEASKTDKDYKTELVKSVLGSGGKISIEIIDKHKQHYTLSRIFNETSTIVDGTGKVLNIPIQTVLNNPLYFGQKDLALTRKGYELDLLNKIVGENAVDVKKELEESVASITENIVKCKEVADIPDKIKDITTSNAELEHKLKIYKEKGIDEKLKKQTACNDDLLKLTTLYNQVNSVKESLDSVFEKIDLDTIGKEELKSEYNQEILSEAYSVSQLIRKILLQIVKEKEELGGELSNLSTIKCKLEEKIESLKEEFAQIKREINDDSIDVDSYILYQKRYAENNTEIHKLKESLKQKETLQANLKCAFANRNELLRQQYSAYESEIERINGGQDMLKIAIEFKGNKELFDDIIRSNFKGTGLNDSKYKILVNEFSDFAALIEDYYLNDGKKIYDCCGANYSKVAEKIEANYSEFIKLETPDLISIMYHDKPLSKHSLGQRASALILFILTQNDSDLIIIDQPEDDLDNQVIYKELIQTIRKQKEYMQFIFATHNANIPVLGDAERIVTVEFDAEAQKILMKQGTIDTEETHEKIVDIMEGGEEAFRLRNEIYSAW